MAAFILEIAGVTLAGTFRRWTSMEEHKEQ